MVSCNVLIPQFFWFKKVRHNVVVIFILCIFINIGMWFERFVIIATSLARSFLPASWSYYQPDAVRRRRCSSARSACSSRCSSCSSGSCRSIAMSEVKGAMPEAHAGGTKGRH